MLFINLRSSRAFEITDLYSTGGNGDLNVTIEEADGTQQNFVVAYASLPVLRREGSLKYSITSGQYRSSDGSVDYTPFSQATASYGLPYNTTLYGDSGCFEISISGHWRR